jgi:origin recognition complex subunit 3
VPFPSQFLNPNTRQAVFTALVHPGDYLNHSSSSQSHGGLSTIEKTDTGILFSLYLQSGRAINVHDWFEAFCSVIEQQNEEEEEETEVDNDENVLQARFIRALHELDHMGFVRHAGRKADHITRTVFDCLL